MKFPQLFQPTRSKVSILFLLILGISYGVIGQQTSSDSLGYWHISNEVSGNNKSAINLVKGKGFKLDAGKFEVILNSTKNGHNSFVIEIPMPDGAIQKFNIHQSTILPPALSQKYPEIKSYSGVAIENNNASIKVDIGPAGFYAMIMTDTATIFLDPIGEKGNNTYVSYNKNKYKIGKDMGRDYFEISPKKINSSPNIVAKTFENNITTSSGELLRTYRIAIAATGEYTIFHGGSLVDGLSAIVTTMNRINGIFERELSISFTLVQNNDLLIYTSPDTDPYTNNNAEMLMTENQSNIDNVIGTNNYDIGHVFSTASGGVATLASVCDPQFKAQGTTGTGQPVGDPFDVDFVAHELGHQFGADHTFNGTAGSCGGFNRSGSTAYEPGSGSTIMAYAGLCSPQNIQNQSDDYFHTISYQQIMEFVTIGGGNCAQLTMTGNQPPVANAGPDYIIPANTAFALTGSATDQDDDNLTFCWEQFNLGPAGPPNDANISGPLFRSFQPNESPTRVFPQLDNLLNNINAPGEILPETGQTLTFRLTARDNHSGSGGVDYDEVDITVVETDQPFSISNFNDSAIRFSSTPINLIWNVAETNIDPINVTEVNILYSIDGGNSFPITLLSAVENDGIETIILPDIATSQGRIKIEAVENIFFDINNTNFSVDIPTVPNFVILQDPINVEICSPNIQEFNIQIASVLGFNDLVTLSLVNLPENLDFAFSENPVMPGSTINLTLSNSNLVNPGNYSISLKGEADGILRQVDFEVSILSGIPFPPVPAAPADESEEVVLLPLLTWINDENVLSYSLEIAKDPDFNEIILNPQLLDQPSYQVIQRLEGHTTYYWRIISENACGISDYSPTYSFTTELINYFEYSGINLPLIISDGAPNTITSTIEIIEDIIISDINISALQGKHSYISDLSVTLEGPDGTIVTLFSGICSNEDDFDLMLDDEAFNLQFNCPPTDGLPYKPLGNLSSFNDKNGKGIWTLTIEDNFLQDGGSLDFWQIEIGTDQSPPDPPNSLVAIPTSTTSISLTWNDVSNNEDYFLLERSDGNGMIENIELDKNTMLYVDEFLSEESGYFYRLKSVNSYGESDFSQQIFSTTHPLSPTNLMVIPLSKNSIEITWVDNSSIETEYVLERSIGNDENFSQIKKLAADVEIYENINLVEGVTYFYRTYAQNDHGASDYSTIQEATTIIVDNNSIVNNEIQLFPNPVENNLTVFTTLPEFNVEQIKVIDLQGREVPIPKALQLGDHYHIDLSFLTKGIYFISIYGNSGHVLQKIIKQ